MNQLIDEKPTLLLKWGTVKGWDNFPKGKLSKMLEEYLKDSSFSCAMDKPDEARKALLCKIIDKFDGTIWNDWDNKKMTKKQAKKYVMGFGL